MLKCSSIAGYREPKWRLMSTLSGYHERTIFSVDWSKQNLVAAGEIHTADLWFNSSCKHLIQCCFSFSLQATWLCPSCILAFQTRYSYLCVILPSFIWRNIVKAPAASSWCWSNLRRFVNSCAGSQDNGIRIFQVTLREKAPEQTSREPPGIELLHCESDAHASDVNCVRWHPTKPHILASTSDDNSLRIWHVDLPGNDQQIAAEEWACSSWLLYTYSVCWILGVVTDI